MSNNSKAAEFVNYLDSLTSGPVILGSLTEFPMKLNFATGRRTNETVQVIYLEQFGMFSVSVALGYRSSSLDSKFAKAREIFFGFHLTDQGRIYSVRSIVDGSCSPQGLYEAVQHVLFAALDYRKITHIKKEF